MYIGHGQIKPPVRAWKEVKYAEKFSKQTGRKIIIRLLANNTFKALEGHKGNAVYSEVPYPIKNMEL